MGGSKVEKVFFQAVLAHLSPDLYTKGISERNKTLGQLPATMV